MRRFVIFLGAGLALLILQTTLLAAPSGGWWRPDLVLVMVGYLGLYWGSLRGVLLTFLLGYAMDLLSGSMFGLHIFTRLVDFGAAYLIGQRFYRYSAVYDLKLCMVLALLDGVVTALFIQAAGAGTPAVEVAALLLIPQVLLAGIFCPPVFVLLQRAERVLRRPVPA
ncbi:MAG: rod shape-determining protein MreD [Deltaproteobacteria bacterium]|nr:rod shape-determining protein MreD [Deltaproteobacteria bacterium]